MAIDFTLTPELEEIRQRVRTFINEVVKPGEAELAQLRAHNRALEEEKARLLRLNEGLEAGFVACRSHIDGMYRDFEGRRETRSPRCTLRKVGKAGSVPFFTPAHPLRTDRSLLSNGGNVEVVSSGLGRTVDEIEVAIVCMKHFAPPRSGLVGDTKSVLCSALPDRVEGARLVL